VGRVLDCKIIELDKNRNNVVLSRRAYLEETQREQRDEFLANLKPGEVRNPNMQAGVYTTAEDYAKFLSMLAAGGVYQGHRVLSQKAFDEMETLQTGKVTFGYRPPGANPTDQYALANWCETFEPSGRCKAVSSPGAFGTYPWIDRPSGLYGVFFLKHRLPAVAKDLRQARGIVLQSQGAKP